MGVRRSAIRQNVTGATDSAEDRNVSPPTEHAPARPVGEQRFPAPNCCSKPDIFIFDKRLTSGNGCYSEDYDNRQDAFQWTGTGDGVVTDEEPAVEELFGLLGNETRMRIMRALWEQFDFSAYVIEDREGTSFATLRERTGVGDSGNFNYHLGQLSGVLVEDREDGYVLTPLGYNLMRAIERYATFEYDTVDEQVLDDPCPFCGGDLVAEYRREVLGVRCRNCPGLALDGNFTFVQLPATGARHLSLPELLDAATLAMFSKITASFHGICWECRAPMERTYEVCEEHDPGPAGICDACDLRFRTLVYAECSNCGTGGRGPILEYAVVSSAVRALLADADCGPEQIGPWNYRLAVFETVADSTVETDPTAVEIGFELDGRTECVRIEDAPERVSVDIL